MRPHGRAGEHGKEREKGHVCRYCCVDKPAAALASLAAPSMRLLCVYPGCCLQVGTSVLVWAGVAVGWLICSILPSVLPLYV